MITDEMVEAAAEAIRNSWKDGKFVEEAARSALLAALAAVPVAKEVEEIARFVERCVRFTELAAWEELEIDGLSSIDIVCGNPFDRDDEGVEAGPLAASLLRRLSAEVTYLTPYVEAFRREERRADLATERVCDLEAERDEAIRQRDEAREALKPFATAANEYDPDEGDGDVGACGSLFFIGHLRRARAALQGGEHDR